MEEVKLFSCVAVDWLQLDAVDCRVFSAKGRKLDSDGDEPRGDPLNCAYSSCEHLGQANSCSAEAEKCRNYCRQGPAMSAGRSGQLQSMVK